MLLPISGHFGGGVGKTCFRFLDPTYRICTLVLLHCLSCSCFDLDRRCLDFSMVWHCLVFLVRWSMYLGFYYFGVSSAFNPVHDLAFFFCFIVDIICDFYHNFCVLVAFLFRVGTVSLFDMVFVCNFIYHFSMYLVPVLKHPWSVLLLPSHLLFLFWGDAFHYDVLDW